MVKQPERIRVAIVGGGCAGLTAAFELTRPEQKGRFEVTVFESAHCLGGKGASHRHTWYRGEHAHVRTEEHGLHVWMGFYENSFRIMRDCYAALAKCHVDDPRMRASLYGDWREAFIPDPYIGVADHTADGWRTWTAYFPPNPGQPGDPIDEETNPFTMRSYVARSIDLLRALVRSTFVGQPGLPSEDENRVDFSEVSPRAVVDKLTSVLRAGVFASVAALYEGLSILKLVLGATTEPGLLDSEFKVLQFADAIADSLRKQAEDLFRVDESMRPKLELIELVVTVIVGILRDQLLSDDDGLDAINDEDCRAWLKRHGASQRAVDSPVVRALYDMAFVEGAARPRSPNEPPEADEPGLAAGQALRGALRMFFTYRGALFWKLRAGMGDVVFSPLYEVLKLRGVKFEFFHRLTDVVPSEDGGSRHVAALHFHVTHAVRRRMEEEQWKPAERRAAEDGEYYPLDADGCWPRDIDEQRAVAAPRERQLNVGHDFDFAVLAIGGGAVLHACPSLIEHDRNFRAMAGHLKTTRTQALQLWLNEGLETLCNPPEEGEGEIALRPQLPTPITVAGFEAPFDTWSDMTHVIAQESWPEPPHGLGRPKGLAYFCGAVQNRNQSDAETLDAAIRFIDGSLPKLWPGARDPDTRLFRWELLARDGFGPAQTQSEKRHALKSQYLHASPEGSDEYVLSRPGTLHYRISPLDQTFDNFTVAGDWTDAGFNEGCVEAAVMSGRLASHALSAFPALEDIIGYDHP